VSTLLLLISILDASALVKEKSLKDLVTESDNVIVGKVIDKKSYWEGGKIFTDVTISVDLYFKGNPDNQIIIKVPGGAVGDIFAEVSDVPFFENDEEVFLFSKGNEVVGWNQGKFTIKNDKIKETGESLAEFVHKIKKEGQIKNEKGKMGRDIDVVSEKLNTKSIEQISANASKSNVITEPTLIDAAWSSIKYEGFEGAFPNTWTTYGSPTWCDTSYKSAVGSWSGWPGCAGTGAIPSNGKYPKNLNSWMVYGPFSLVGATEALVTFKHWTDTEEGHDYFQYMASIDGSNFSGNQLSGNWTPWKDETFDLKNVYSLGDLRGQPSVWIAFRFVSDSSVQDYGTFLDEINIQKYTTPSTAPHIIDITPNSGPAKCAQLGNPTAAADSTLVIINGTNLGTITGSARFWRIGTTTYDATIVSWNDSQIVAKVPGEISSYTKPDGTGNVQIVKSDGTPSDNYGNFRVTYSSGGGKWPGIGTIYKVNPNTFDITGELEAVQAAANTWNTAGANFGFTYGGLSTKTSVAYDEENSMIWGTTGGSIATTWTYWGADPHVILQNDIIFDDGLTWDTNVSSLKMDVQTIALHELGHWLQLLDLYGGADSGKTMYGYGSNGIIKRTLSADDTAGIVAIYGMDENVNPVHNLNTGLDYSTIQGAIYAPETLNGHTLKVDPGIYMENIDVNKSLVITGSGFNTIINGSGANAVTITANNVNISGFTITNGFYGVYVNHVNNANISSNNISNNIYGIRTDISSGDIINGNIIRNNPYSGLNMEFTSLSNISNNEMQRNGFAIYGLYSDNNNILSNNLSNNDFYGLFIDNSDDNSIVDNMITNNPYAGLAMYFGSNNNAINNNEFRKNGFGSYIFSSSLNTFADNYFNNTFYGVYLDSSSNNLLDNNTIDNNPYAGLALYFGSNSNNVTRNNLTNNGFGSYIYQSHGNNISFNKFHNLCYGVYLDQSNNSNITNNDIFNNPYAGLALYYGGIGNQIELNNLTGNGFGVYSESSGNTIYHNNLVSNIVHAYDNGLNSWNNSYPAGGNFWNGWTSPDIKSGPNQDMAGSDGIVDNPYNIAGGANQDGYPHVGVI